MMLLGPHWACSIGKHTIECLRFDENGELFLCIPSLKLATSNHLLKSIELTHISSAESLLSDNNGLIVADLGSDLD